MSDPRRLGLERIFLARCPVGCRLRCSAAPLRLAVGRRILSRILILKTMSDQRFCGKTIVITGAGGNFGRAGCIFFAKNGARIAALDNNDAALNQTVRDVNAALEGEQSVIQSYNCDVTSPKSVEETIEKISKDFGDIHMLWNNAG